ncbi:MAG: hypothetical protein AABX83_03145 [Nanoarchaeota archaeon]
MLDLEIRDFLRKAHIGDRVKVGFEDGVFDRRFKECEGYVSKLTNHTIGLSFDLSVERSDKEILLCSIYDYQFMDYSLKRFRSSI